MKTLGLNGDSVLGFPTHPIKGPKGVTHGDPVAALFPWQLHLSSGTCVFALLSSSFGARARCAPVRSKVPVPQAVVAAKSRPQLDNGGGDAFAALLFTSIVEGVAHEPVGTGASFIAAAGDLDRVRAS